MPPGFRRRATVARILIAAILAVVLATPASGAWRQFHAGPARLGISSDRSLSPSNIGRLRVKWSRATGNSAEGINSSAAVVDGRVFVGSDDGRLYAFGVGGARLWAKPVGGAVRSSPAVSDGVVYVGSDHGHLQARAVGSGSLRWSRTLNGVISSSPLVAEHRVYIGTRGGTFYALKASTGAIVWKKSVWSVWDAAAYRGGVVYVGSDRSRVWAFDADTGARRWVAPLVRQLMGDGIAETIVTPDDLTRPGREPDLHGHALWELGLAPEAALAVAGTPRGLRAVDDAVGHAGEAVLVDVVGGR